MTLLAENLERVEEAITTACRKAGRHRGEVELMAVSKTYPAETVIAAAELGLRMFGESRVQEFAAKSPALEGWRAGGSNAAADEPLLVHLIGHLQSNKAARAVELFDAVDSVDSLRLAEKLNEAAARLGKRLDILVEINMGGEEAKSGLAPDSSELLALLDAQARLTHLNVRGCMTVPPYTEDPEGARVYFRKLSELRDRLRVRSGLPLEELSMGMSHDFEVAIEEGSTCVRVGTAIFGERSYQ